RAVELGRRLLGSGVERGLLGLDLGLDLLRAGVCGGVQGCHSFGGRLVHGLGDDLRRFGSAVHLRRREASTAATSSSATPSAGGALGPPARGLGRTGTRGRTRASATGLRRTRTRGRTRACATDLRRTGSRACPTGFRRTGTGTRLRPGPGAFRGAGASTRA